MRLIANVPRYTAWAAYCHTLRVFTSDSSTPGALTAVTFRPQLLLPGDGNNMVSGGRLFAGAPVRACAKAYHRRGAQYTNSSPFRF
jgi:LPS sulfotransferase NodH